MMRILASMFSRRWLMTTLLVFAGTALCVRLGIWQLDRLSQRREFNQHMTQMWALPPLVLNSANFDELTRMEYRAVQVTGIYDFADQVALRNQYHENQLGYHLLTPLLMNNGSAVLVDRGWIPADGNASPSDWRKYDETGVVTIHGILRLGPAKPELGGVPDPALGPDQTRLDLWNMINLERISLQVQHPLLDVFIQPDADASDDVPPIPYQAHIELSEGPHLGYAGQWFTFAAMLFFGYPFFYLRKQAIDL
jgi:surfeit locus 1 family protein